MNHHAEKFKLVGYRFQKLLVDESGFGHNRKGPVEITISSAEPIISDQTMQGRPVIELVLRIDAVAMLGSGKKPSKDSMQKTLVSASCVGGFVGGDPSDDGKLEAFAEYEQYFARGLYWLTRQRLGTNLSMTRFRSVQLPWDLDITPREAERELEPTKMKKQKPKRKAR